MQSVLGNVKGASVSANLRVVVQQPTAILRALDMLNTKYLATRKNPMTGWENAKKYAPIAQWKDWGYFDISNGKSTKSLLFDNATKLDKLNDALMTPAAKADAISWGHLWNCVEEEIRDTTDLKPDTADFYHAVAKRFTELVDHTQVVDGILQRSQIMRSGNAFTKVATSFMGEPTKQYTALLGKTGAHPLFFAATDKICHILMQLRHKRVKVAVLEEGMKYTPISISPNEAQFLETRKFQIDEIARIFRVPPHMVGDLEKSSFSMRFNHLFQKNVDMINEGRLSLKDIRDILGDEYDLHIEVRNA